MNLNAKRVLNEALFLLARDQIFESSIDHSGWVENQIFGIKERSYQGLHALMQAITAEFKGLVAQPGFNEALFKAPEGGNPENNSHGIESSLC